MNWRSLKFNSPAWLLGLIFLVAGFSKLGQSELVFAGVMQYELVQANTAFQIADALPWIEIVLGIALFVPKLQPFALIAAAALQSLFLLALIQAAWRGLEIVCICFGTKTMGTSMLFVQEIFLLALTALAIWLRRKLPQK